MKKNEMAIMTQLLLEPKKPKLDILEWGCGGSTVYFTKLLKDKGIQYTWTSIEHHEEWYNNIHSQIPDKDKIQLLLIKTDDGQCDNSGNLENCRYVNYPLSLNMKFDFILVDGRHREACTRLASQLIKNDGMVVVHDAQRKRYHPAFKLFNSGKFMSYRVWVGNNRKAGLVKKTVNLFNYYYFRFVVKRLKKIFKQSSE